MNLSQWLSGRRKIVVFGELGSGKTEVSMNLALQLRRQTGQVVRFMDMDQTKPMYRARDVQALLQAQGVQVVAEEQFMDAPTVEPGVREKMEDDVYTVMDVGGSFHGALCMGQFADLIHRVDALVLYLINPFRPFSDTTEHIAQTMAGILSCCHLTHVTVASNPYAGDETALSDILEGHATLCARMEPLQRKVEASFVQDAFYEAAAEKLGVPCFPVTPLLPYVLSPVDSPL